LVEEAVQGPRLHLPAVEAALDHQAVEGVPVVVPRRAERAQLALQGVGFEAVIDHGSISIPSWAISQPVAATLARSGEPSRRAGLVLLMWTNSRRPTFTRRSRAIAPSGPLIATWPMRWPVFADAPSR